MLCLVTKSSINQRSVTQPTPPVHPFSFSERLEDNLGPLTAQMASVVWSKLIEAKGAFLKENRRSEF